MLLFLQGVRGGVVPFSLSLSTLSLSLSTRWFIERVYDVHLYRFITFIVVALWSGTYFLVLDTV